MAKKVSVDISMAEKVSVDFWKQKHPEIVRNVKKAKTTPDTCEGPFRFLTIDNGNPTRNSLCDCNLALSYGDEQAYV